MDRRSPGLKILPETFFPFLKNNKIMQTTTTDATELFVDLDKTTDALLHLITSVSQQKINAIPFEDSWTAAQLATHVSKSNNAIAQGLNMQGKPAHRNID